MAETATSAPHVELLIVLESRLLGEALGEELLARGWRARACPPDALSARLAEHRPTHLLVDAGIFGTQDLLRAADDPGLRVIVLENQAGSSPSHVTRMAGSDRLGALVDLLRAGIAPRRARTPIAAAVTASGGAPLSMLTEREREVVELLVQVGRTDAIADCLEISVHTVRTHLQNVYAKLGVNNRHQLVALAMKAGVRSRRVLSGEVPA
jgi:DNA-binding CsgD family transcriptional regulator